MATVLAIASYALAAPAALAVNFSPGVSIAYGSSPIPLNGSTSLTFTIGNPNPSVNYSNVAFTDNLPKGVVVASPPSVTNSCGGTIAANAGSSSVALSNGSVSARGECTVVVNVDGTWGGTTNNSVQVTTSDGSGDGSASLTVLGPPPGNRLYWGNGNAISYANVDGGGGGDLATGNATVDDPNGVAIDSVTGRIYWANFAANKISYANLDGTGGGDLATGNATVDEPISVAIDPVAGKIYWANQAGGTGLSHGVISWANLDQSGGGDLSTGGATVGTPQGVALDLATGRLYWADGDGFISYADLNTTGGGYISTTGATVSAPTGVAIDPGTNRIYWANFNGPETISYADLNQTGGGDLTTGSATRVNPTGVAIDPAANQIYWTNLGSDAISFVNLGGGGGGEINTPYTASSSGNQLPLLQQAPEPAGAPAITGGDMVGSILSCSAGSWAPDLLESLLYREPQSFSYQWRLNSTNIPGATSSSYTPSSPGSYSCSVTGSNPAGSATQTSGGHTVTPTSTPAATSAGTPSGSPMLGSPTPSRPSITDARLRVRRFRVSRVATAVLARKVPRGTSLLFRLSEPAKIQIRIFRLVAGVRSDGSCRTPTPKLKRAHAKTCLRSIAVGTLTRTAEPPGPDTVPFSGRIGRRALPPSSYHAVLGASNANGTSAPVTLSFAIVR